MNDNSRSMDARRPGVWLAGNNINVSNLSATGRQGVNIRITADHLTWMGGIVQGAGEAGDNIGLDFTIPPDMKRSEILDYARHVRIQGVAVENCRPGILLDPEAKDVEVDKNFYFGNAADVVNVSPVR